MAQSASESDQVLWEATFNPRVKTYWLWSGALILLVSVVGIVLLPLWFIIGYALTGRYLSHMRCTLTPKHLRVSKGMFVRVEKTVPLDKITDLGLVHGPLMRALDLQALSIETAGQSSAGALVRLVGIDDTVRFREAVLEQRDRVMALEAKGETGGALPAATGGGGDAALLTEIRDVLVRIESGLAGGSSTPFEAPPKD